MLMSFKGKGVQEQHASCLVWSQTVLAREKAGTLCTLISSAIEVKGLMAPVNTEGPETGMCGNLYESMKQPFEHIL